MPPSTVAPLRRRSLGVARAEGTSSARTTEGSRAVQGSPSMRARAEPGRPPDRAHGRHPSITTLLRKIRTSSVCRRTPVLERSSAGGRARRVAADVQRLGSLFERQAVGGWMASMVSAAVSWNRSCASRTRRRRLAVGVAARTRPRWAVLALGPAVGRDRLHHQAPAGCPEGPADRDRVCRPQPRRPAGVVQHLAHQALKAAVVGRVGGLDQAALDRQPSFISTMAFAIGLHSRTCPDSSARSRPPSGAPWPGRRAG